MIILGVNAYHPDASAVLIRDGAIIWAAEEERFSRIKHAAGFPSLAIRKGLEFCALKAEAIDRIAISRDPSAHRVRKAFYAVTHPQTISLVLNRIKAMGALRGIVNDLAETLSLPASVIRGKICNVEHHLSHVSSSYFASGYEKAAFMSIDGLGDFSSGMWGYVDRGKFSVINQIFFPHSVGFLYTAATQFLGFHHFGDEYKVMGLAAYGKPTYKEQFRKMINLLPDGRFELNLSYFLHPQGKAKVKWDKGAPEQDLLYSDQWQRLFGPPQLPGALSTEREKNMASSLQSVLEDVYFHILNKLHEQTKSDHLVLAGGVAFNGVANGKIARKTPFRNIYIQAAAGDAGTALGAAYYVYSSQSKQAAVEVMKHASLGMGYSNDSIKQALDKTVLRYECLDEDTLLKKTARLIDEGMVIGWFHGRMEFGPRALGNRSIIADPRRKDIRDILNERVKNREMFRPFAPFVPVERAHEFFDMDCEESPFMLKVFPVKPDKSHIIPAVTHVDGTARVQTIGREENPRVWKLLNVFGELTGVPVLLNTSFNEHEPIVCSPQEAIDCFMKTKMDYLVLENFLVYKSDENIKSNTAKTNNR